MDHQVLVTTMYPARVDSPGEWLRSDRVEAQRG
jgi:hypothetical protein